jgi:hypothetical protein
MTHPFPSPQTPQATAAQNTKWLKEARGAEETDFFVDLQSLPFCNV